MQLDKITTGVSYGASGSSAVFWFERLLNGYTPEQWEAIGVLGSLAFAGITFLVNLIGREIFKRETCDKCGSTWDKLDLSGTGHGD